MKINEMIASDEFNKKFGEAEIWKTIKDCPNYMVSTLGRVMNLETGKILKPQDNGTGYLYIPLRTEDGLQINKYVHRLVAEAFLDKKSFQSVDETDAFASTFGFENFDYLQVNHRDECKTNNCVSNLEWCTNLYNNRYGNRGKKISEAQKGKKLSEETRRKISEAKKAFYAAKRFNEDAAIAIDNGLAKVEEIEEKLVMVDLFNLNDEAITVDEENETLEINI